jgi:tetrapyrrole methylase family protein/MazG family protein
VIARLRTPDGCPWDREQTHTSLRPFLIEEAYEALDALDRDDMSDLEEELGDLLLQIVLHAQIANEEGDFNIQQVLEGINTKLIRRHPHVFSEVEVEGVSGVIKNWEAIKAEERRENAESNKKGILDGVPKALPALLQAQEIVERVRRMGLNPWNEGNQLTDLCKMVEDYETAENSRKPVILGDILLLMAAIAHDEKIDLESALRQSLNQFRNKFGMMEDQVLQAGKSLSDLSSPEKAQLWRQTVFNEEDKSTR